MLVIACSQTLYVPSPETVSEAHLIPELAEGRKLYIKNCGSCHNLYSPGKYPRYHWEKEMTEMQAEAKITDAESALILKYLLHGAKS